MRTVGRWLLLLLTLGWMGLIFYMSAATGGESGGMSREVAMAVGKTFHSDFEQWSAEEQAAFAQRLQQPIRKLAHFSEYALLGLLLSFTLQLWGMGGKRRFFAALAGGVFYAATDEFHQLFVPGRVGAVTDVLIDSAGVLGGCALVALILYIHKKRRRV